MENYIGEIRMFAGDYAPEGWALCNGQLLNLQQNEALFSLLGTTYGGDGQTTFALPDLRGRVPIHKTAQHPLGVAGGSEQVSLTDANLPVHTHGILATTAPSDSASPTNAVWSTATKTNYSNVTPTPALVIMGNSLTEQGGGAPHPNMMPSACVNFIIATTGIYPSGY